MADNTGSAWDFSFETLTGKPLPLSEFKGKAVLVVNTASQCGFTPQYKDLEELAKKYKGQGLVVLGVPCNDFGGQEPGSAEEIGAFCEKNYGVSFPMAGKAKVTGGDAHPFYAWARKKVGILGSPKWNFHKYLIAPDGSLADWFSTPTKPTADKVSRAIEKILPKTP
ncbi:MAG TPA: glutathione peroxidase [Magnetospirillaceae bacterium]|jgi:glutathione peroxidase